MWGQVSSKLLGNEKSLWKEKRICPASPKATDMGILEKVGAVDNPLLPSFRWRPWAWLG